MRMILFIAGIVICIFASISFFGKNFARNHPNFLVFSFQNGPFSWDYTFNDGNVSIFIIGSNRKQVVDAVKNCQCFQIYPIKEQMPRVGIDGISYKNLDLYFPNEGSTILSSQESVVPITYELRFVQGKLESVRISSSPFSGL